ncbi:MAG: FAD-dependent oxidoreductase [Spirochaeta sp.]
MKLVIIGGVAAGATAAARARRLDGSAEITILEAGADVSFANCGLPYYIGGEVEHRSSLLMASPESLYDQYQINIHIHTEAVKIDRSAQRVTARNTQTGEQREFPYDALILAQGGKPIVPPLPGVDQENVFQLWTLQDMDAIDAFIRDRSPRSAAVIGGGFIGLEMVEAFAHRGLQVSLVEAAPQVMLNLEPEFAGYLTQQLQDYGVDLHIGTALAGIDGSTVKLSDGSSVTADMVLLSIGVKPTLQLAREAGLEIGESGGLLVNSRLQTSDERIFAAGDMAEIDHFVLGTRVRIPLAGPANRQGRIAAENALGGQKEYRGAMGTSIVKLFDTAAGSVGVSRTAARRAGLQADAVVVHKVSHTSYYPGSDKVSLMLVYNRDTGVVLGAQAAGRTGVDKRLDVIAAAIAGRLTIDDLQELDFAYAPPFNSANGPINMAAFTAVNNRDGFSRGVPALDLDGFVQEHNPLIIDIRDPISYKQAHIDGSRNMSQGRLRDRMPEFDRDRVILLVSEDGQKGHVALRMLAAGGFTRVYNLSGGYISLERHARAYGYLQLDVGLFPVQQKSAVESAAGGTAGETGGEGSGQSAGEETGQSADGETGPDAAVEDGSSPLIIDVRTSQEYAAGAHPDAVNIELDQLADKAQELGVKDREITLYCASGARSAYGKRVLEKHGFTNVKNGGGLHDVLG